MSLNATPESPTADSYVTEAEATALLTNGRLYTSAWAAADVPTRETALRWATSLLETGIRWRGYKRTLEQSLAWPRYDVYDPDGNVYDWDTIPLPVKAATADLAFELVKRDPTEIPELLGLGIVEASVGNLRARLDPKMVLPLIPEYVLVGIAHLGAAAPGAAGGGGGVVNLRRA